MPFLQSFLTAPSSPLNSLLSCVSITVPPFSDFTFDYSYFQSKSAKLSCHSFPARNTNSSTASFSFFKPNPFRALLFTVDVRDFESKVLINSSGKQILNSPIPCSVDSAQNVDNEDDKEQQRRKKIGLANKGRVPWNKGRKHDDETRERIKQRTIEALKDPKVRKKMAAHPRPQSVQIKDKISCALRRIWAERLKRKRQNEKFFSSWAESIALAARKGEEEQEELDWDSYDKIREMIISQWDAEKAEAKEMAKKKAEIAAKIKANKKARLSAKRKKQRKKAKAREEIKEIKVTDRLKLRQRLTKIRKKRSMNGQASSRGNLATSQITAWERLDLEFIAKDQTWKRASLADQIQIAKNSRAESMTGKFIGAHSQRSE